ncbi:hypothetical protein FOL47_009722 [Perkinsus chesapeaki]|uniref:Uncharacterized protein n=1 Tax=Perkinsus chesapeaki TaxID=330153 RepID=A0A7J6N4E6_PERCH|nr:hypothetical protein FOL47_009722 [Perkinsus chesapeaki]
MKSSSKQKKPFGNGSGSRSLPTRRAFSCRALPCRDDIEFVSSEVVTQVHELGAQRESLLAEIERLKKRRHLNQIRLRKTTNQLDEDNGEAVELEKKCEALESENAGKQNALNGARRDYAIAEKEATDKERCSEGLSRELLAIRAEVTRTKPNVLSARKQLGLAELEKDRVAASVNRVDRECKVSSSRLDELLRHSSQLTRSLHDATASSAIPQGTIRGAGSPCGLWQEPAQLYYLDALKGINGDQFGDANGYVCVSRCGSGIHDPVCPNTSPAASCLLEDSVEAGQDYCIGTCITAQDCDTTGVNARNYRCVHGTPGSTGFRGICVHEVSFKDMPGMGEMKKLNFMSQSKLLQQALHPARVGTIVEEPGASTAQSNNKELLQTLAAANTELEVLGRRYGMASDHDFQALKKHLADIGKGRSVSSSPPMFESPGIGDSLASSVKGAVKTMLHPLESVQSALAGAAAPRSPPSQSSTSQHNSFSGPVVQQPAGVVYTLQVIGVMFFFYLLLGYIYNCHVNGASGVNAIPHKGTWTSIPALVASAAAYCRALCSSSSSIAGSGGFTGKSFFILMRPTSFLFCLPARLGSFLYGLSEALFCAIVCIRCYVSGVRGLDLLSLAIVKVLVSLNGLDYDQSSKFKATFQQSLSSHIPFEALSLYNTICVCFCLFVGLTASLGMIGVGAKIPVLVRIFQAAEVLSIIGAVAIIIFIVPYTSDYAAALSSLDQQQSDIHKMAGAWLLSVLSKPEAVEGLLGCIGVLWTLVRVYGLSLVTDSIVEVKKANSELQELVEPFLRRHLRRVPE